jgi:hypothetical protein
MGVTSARYKKSHSHAQYSKPEQVNAVKTAARVQKRRQWTNALGGHVYVLPRFTSLGLRLRVRGYAALSNTRQCRLCCVPLSVGSTQSILSTLRTKRCVAFSRMQMLG